MLDKCKLAIPTYYYWIAIADLRAPKEGMVPVAWRREWDGDVSDANMWLYVEDKNERDEPMERWEELFAAAPKTDAEPKEGMVMVPVEPTPEMMQAGVVADCLRRANHENVYMELLRLDAVYKAMIAAAPNTDEPVVPGTKEHPIYKCGCANGCASASCDKR